MKHQQQSSGLKQDHPPGVLQRENHWVVVADHKKAHIYQKTASGIERVADTDSCCSRPFPEEGTGREDVFLRDLAQWLNTAEREQAFDRLVLIAPPATLEEIRALLGEKVNTRVCEGLDRDIEQVTQDEIEDHLTEVVWL